MSKLPWHGPLFSVKGHLAERYALALKHARGLDCPIAEFSIDRMGWSPQLAAALGDDYLGGEAMRYAIILSPDQSGASLLRRRFSYEAPLMEQVYLEARATILGLIEHEPVVVELDNGLTFCRTPMDALNIQAAVARIETPLNTLARSRQLLELAHGLGEKARLLDDGYIDQMLALAKDVGDPRRRPMPPGLRVPIGSLWAMVAGAVYILRPPAGRRAGDVPKGGDTIVIATRVDEALKSLPALAVELDEPALVDLLLEAGFLRFGNEITLLRKRLGELELEALLSTGEVAPAPEGAPRRKQLAASSAAQEALPPLYWELDAEQKRMAAGGSFNPRRLSVEARWALAVPAREPDVLGHLLARFVRFDYRLMTHHHRRIVRAEWGRYSEAKRRYLEATYPYITQGFVSKPETTPITKHL
ncbi:MAG TPA: DUF6638 family protein [Roseiflexaceae bacterium]|nr:DUF6638 family protein [Roseiflexaceae bacterium]